MKIWDLNVAVLYVRFLSYRGGLYNRFDCIRDSMEKKGAKYYQQTNDILYYIYGKSNGWEME